jgi:hypothetical protein
VNYNLINTQNPAHAVITLYLPRVGVTNPLVPTGMLAPGSLPAKTTVEPQVTIDGRGC